MLITSFKIDHKKLKPGVYLHEVKKFNNSYVTTYDLRFKIPNKPPFLSIKAIHTLEHMIATFYTTKYPKDKIYFGPMGCQTGFYLVVYGKKDLNWILSTLDSLDKYINGLKLVPGNSPTHCGNYKTLDLKQAKLAWNKWFRNKSNWGNKYIVLK